MVPIFVYQVSEELNGSVILLSHFVAESDLKSCPGNGWMVRVKVDETLIFGNGLVVVFSLIQIVGKP
jgi:hypothetical protein